MMLLDKANSKQLALLTPNKDGLGVFHLALKVTGSSAVVCIRVLKHVHAALCLHFVTWRCDLICSPVF